MKKTSKIFSVMLAVALVFAMAIPAFAVETWTGSITVKGTTTVPVTGKTFNAYQILTAEAVDENDLSKGVIYSIPVKMATFFAAYGADVNAVVETINNMDAAALQNFSVAALNAAKDAGITATAATNDEAANTATFTGLAFGYYVIEDAGSATPISALMLKSTSAEVTIKADKPSIEKKIDGATDADKTTEGLVDYNTATVGEKVPYVLTSKVPDMTGYTAYTYTVTDTFSKGLTFNNDVKVTVNGVEYDDVTVTAADQVVTINFPNFIGLANQKDAEIKITYSATVNADAEIGVEGNPNTVKLTYSNNPQEATTEDTTEDVVYTYLSTLVINKTDEAGAPLAGAIFAVKNANGDVIATGTSDANGIVEFAWANGVGLKDGETYTIVETDAPAGYNEAKDITFTVTCTDPTTGTDCEWSSNIGEVVYDGAEDRFESTIKNSTGGLLPETGGIGTTIFYVAGIVLVLGAAVLLITKKRMSCEA